MIKEYNNTSLLLGIPGLLLQSAGYAIGDNILLLIGTALLLLGFANYAKAKGRSPAWCLMSLLSWIGLIILGCLKDLTQEPPNKGANTIRGKTEDQLYAQVGREIAQDIYDPASFARATEQATGNQDRVESLYVGLRVEQLTRERERNTRLAEEQRQQAETVRAKNSMANAFANLLLFTGIALLLVLLLLITSDCSR